MTMEEQIVLVLLCSMFVIPGIISLIGLGVCEIVEYIKEGKQQRTDGE